MTDNKNVLFTSPTGDSSQEISIKRIVNFDRYQIEIGLSTSGQFLNILSVKFNKDFTETIRSTANPNVHDVEKYYREE